jgi:hypothetical protein
MSKCTFKPEINLGCTGTSPRASQLSPVGDRLYKDSAANQAKRIIQAELERKAFMDKTKFKPERITKAKDSKFKSSRERETS